MNTKISAANADAPDASPGDGFIFWDGEECRDSGYCLFGCSVFGARPGDSDYIQGRFLRTRDMLDLLLGISAAYPRASHVAFNFDYDVNQILNELDWRTLITLSVKGKAEWDGYKIEHIPHKIFKVSKDGVSIRIDDCFSFFRCRYDKALRKFGVGDPHELDTIADGKDNRADFWWRDIDSIRYYWGSECLLGCHLMDRIRSMCRTAGFHVHQWYGPGALAAYSLKQHKVEARMKPSPVRVHASALSAYAGGWFERFKMGRHDGPVWTYDINSAYIHAMSLLPDLASGHWEHVQGSPVELAALSRQCRFGLFHVDWRADFSGYMRSCHGVPFPLFHRDSDGSIHRPLSSQMWLWNPEAANASCTPYAKLTEAWIFHDDGSSPFSWVADMFSLRLAMQASGDPSEKILKWALASYYGRLAQRSGWDQRARTAPRFHQIEWAGWITSKCRSMVYEAAFDAAVRGGLVSIDTDGIITTVPVRDERLENGKGNQLGRWKEETYSGLIYIQNGVYWLRRDDGSWEDPKLRGIPNKKLTPEQGMEALDNGGILQLSRRNFKGYRSAIQSERGNWRQWVDTPVSVSAQVCGSRIHAEKLCQSCAAGVPLSGGLHELSVLPARSSISEPHRLPWLSGEDSNARLARLLGREENDYEFISDE